MTDWSYAAWPSGEPYEWMDGGRGEKPDDQIDFHVDLGCGKIRKGRIGVDRYAAPGVHILADLDKGLVHAMSNTPGADAVRVAPSGQRMFSSGDGREFEAPSPGQHRALNAVFHRRTLPFADSTIESIISHHALEHIGDGFIALMDECYRVLKPGAPFRIIVPLFPSMSAVEDPDHRRYFCEGTFEVFCGFPDNHWCESFSVPYTSARFECTDRDIAPLSPPEVRWTAADRRELRTTLRPRK